MSEKTLEIFELCERLAKLLGDREAIADLQLIYEKHPEMFENKQDVKNVINKTIEDPDLITKAKRKGALLAIKPLDNKKVGEVAIENDNGTTIIFHVNKKNFEKMKNFIAKQVSVETPSAKAAPTWLGRCADKSNDLPKCNKTPSIPALDSLPQQSQNVNNNTQQDKPLTKEEFMQQEQEKMANAKNAKETKPKDKDLEI